MQHIYILVYIDSIDSIKINALNTRLVDLEDNMVLTFNKLFVEECC